MCVSDLTQKKQARHSDLGNGIRSVSVSLCPLKLQAATLPLSERRVAVGRTSKLWDSLLQMPKIMKLWM
jgi:hypothetical protein